MNIPADKGFAGDVAMAILGCAVVLAIAFQISQSLARDPAVPGKEGENRVEDELPAAHVRAGAPHGTVSENGGPEENLGLYGETSAEEQGEDSAAGLGAESPYSALATPSGDERPMSPPRQVTPAPMREINPPEGHTVSRKPADEIGEASRPKAERQPEIARAAAVKAKDKDAVQDAMTKLSGPTTDATPEVPIKAAAPSVEMIRGNRRSSERVPGAEKAAGLQ